MNRRHFWTRPAGAVVVATAALAAATIVAVSAAQADQPSPAPVVVPASARRCADLAGLRLPDVAVAGAVADTDGSFTVPPGQGGVGEAPAGTVLTGLPAFCDVELVATNPPSSDKIHIAVWLPLTTWNARFQGVGGGGFVSGISFRALATALRAGYATASTDTGHPASQGDGSFVLDPAGNVDPAQVTDFGYRAIHEMTVAAKDVTKRFYGSAAGYSYFSGCSTGGRQALAEAQRYPLDYNGILAGAPAVDFPRLAPAQLWPQFVMRRAGDLMPACKFAAFRAAVTAACDPLDGVKDGVIGDLADCHFDPRGMVGRSTPCGTITRTDATVMEQIWQGPRDGGTGRFEWYGPEPGSDLSFLAASSGDPLYIASSWFQYWLARDPSFDWTTLTTDTFVRLSDQGVDAFGELASDNPDLASFRAAGGKLVIWAGLADPLIPPQGAVRYYDDVVRRSGGPDAADKYARLFLAPGVGHCGPTGTVGPIPTNPLATVTTWVEHGVAPRTMTATRTGPEGTVVESRPVCAYPLIARYNGHGSTDEAANFHCARH